MNSINMRRHKPNHFSMLNILLQKHVNSTRWNMELQLGSLVYEASASAWTVVSGKVLAIYREGKCMMLLIVVLYQ